MLDLVSYRLANKRTIYNRFLVLSPYLLKLMNKCRYNDDYWTICRLLTFFHSPPIYLTIYLSFFLSFFLPRGEYMSACVCRRYISLFLFSLTLFSSPSLSVSLFIYIYIYIYMCVCVCVCVCVYVYIYIYIYNIYIYW